MRTHLLNQWVSSPNEYCHEAWSKTWRETHQSKLGLSSDYLRKNVAMKHGRNLVLNAPKQTRTIDGVKLTQEYCHETWSKTCRKFNLY